MPPARRYQGRYVLGLMMWIGVHKSFSASKGAISRDLPSLRTYQAQKYFVRHRMDRKYTALVKPLSETFDQMWMCGSGFT